MFHALALGTLSLFLIFMGTTWFATWRGVIRASKIAWSERDFVPKTQLVHSWFAVGLLVLVLITIVAAPVPWFVWIIMVANYVVQHISFRIDFPPRIRRVLRVLKWVSLAAEFLYLVYLAFGVR